MVRKHVAYQSKGNEVLKQKTAYGKVRETQEEREAGLEKHLNQYKGQDAVNVLRPTPEYPDCPVAIIVADGVSTGNREQIHEGKMKYGSQIAVERFSEFAATIPSSIQSSAQLEEIKQQIAEKLASISEEIGESTTTFSSAIMYRDANDKPNALVVNIGDSPLYIVDSKNGEVAVDRGFYSEGYPGIAAAEYFEAMREYGPNPNAAQQAEIDRWKDEFLLRQNSNKSQAITNWLGGTGDGVQRQVVGGEFPTRAQIYTLPLAQYEDPELLVLSDGISDLIDDPYLEEDLVRRGFIDAEDVKKISEGPDSELTRLKLFLDVFAERGRGLKVSPMAVLMNYTANLRRLMESVRTKYHTIANVVYGKYEYDHSIKISAIEAEIKEEVEAQFTPEEQGLFRAKLKVDDQAGASFKLSHYDDLVPLQEQVSKAVVEKLDDQHNAVIMDSPFKGKKKPSLADAFSEYPAFTEEPGVDTPSMKDEKPPSYKEVLEKMGPEEVEMFEHLRRVAMAEQGIRPVEGVAYPNPFSPSDMDTGRLSQQIKEQQGSSQTEAFTRPFPEHTFRNPDDTMALHYDSTLPERMVLREKLLPEISEQALRFSKNVSGLPFSLEADDQKTRRIAYDVLHEAIQKLAKSHNISDIENNLTVPQKEEALRRIFEEIEQSIVAQLSLDSQLDVVLKSSLVKDELEQDIQLTNRSFGDLLTKLYDYANPALNPSRSFLNKNGERFSLFAEAYLPVLQEFLKDRLRQSVEDVN